MHGPYMYTQKEQGEVFISSVATTLGHAHYIYPMYSKRDSTSVAYFTTNA